MLKISAFILSLTILFQSFNFDIIDIQKIPTFVYHLKCHLNEGDSVANFISKHYGATSKSHEKEHQEHKKLPFKHQHINDYNQILFVLNNQNNFLKKIHFTIENTLFKSKSLTLQLFDTNFFQPPRVA